MRRGFREKVSPVDAILKASRGKTLQELVFETRSEQQETRQGKGKEKVRKIEV